MRFFLIIFIVLILGCSAETVSTIKSGRPIGSLKGLAGIDQHLKHQFFEATAYPIPYYFLHYETGPLLGAFESDGGNTHYNNGLPNSINMHLWDKVFDNFAWSLGSICEGETASPYGIGTYKAQVIRIIEPFCGSSEELNDRHFEEFWLLVMGYQAPYEEYQAWNQFFRAGDGSSYLEGASQGKIYGLTKTILLNPYFLLEH